MYRKTLLGIAFIFISLPTIGSCQDLPLPSDNSPVPEPSLQIPSPPSTKPTVNEALPSGSFDPAVGLGKEASSGAKEADLPKFLDRSQLPTDEEGNQLESWPLEELQTLFSGDLSLIVPNNNMFPIGKAMPENRLGVAVKIVNDRIGKFKSQLVKNDKSDREETIAELRFLLRLRFDLDTAFQDFKVREIESRAKKLRTEVDRRAEAAPKWVEAMMTLEQMKVEGINVTDIPSNPITPSVFTPVSPVPNSTIPVPQPYPVPQQLSSPRNFVPAPSY